MSELRLVSKSNNIKAVKLFNEYGVFQDTLLYFDKKGRYCPPGGLIDIEETHVEVPKEIKKALSSLTQGFSSLVTLLDAQNA